MNSRCFAIYFGFYAMLSLSFEALLSVLSGIGFLVCYCIGCRSRKPWRLGAAFILTVAGSLALWLFSDAAMLAELAKKSRVYSEIYTRFGRDLATNDEYLESLKRAHRVWVIKACLVVMLPMVFGLCLPRYARRTQEYRISAASLSEAEPATKAKRDAG